MEAFFREQLLKSKQLLQSTKEVVIDAGDIGVASFSDAIINATRFLLAGTDFRDVKAVAPHPLQQLCWSACPPLASQTQFVERGVKLANIVAATDHREESRAAWAIVRSANVHLAGVDREAINKGKT